MGTSVGGVRLSRRRLLGFGAVAVATGAAMVATSNSVSADTYGSGQLDPWEGLNTSISSDDQIRRVLAADGVFLFGDSIMVQDGNHLARRVLTLTHKPMAMHNWAGQPTEAAVDALERWKTKYGLPSRIVMAVGSNDIFKPPAFGPQVDRAMRIIGPAREVFWVNTYVCRTRESDLVQRADRRNTNWVNRQLDDAERRYPNLHVVRWAEFIATVKSTRHYVRDGVHTTVPLGQRFRDELITDALTSSRQVTGS
ncbi:hypothetical protein GCM10009554_68400 [Kribbella koreensis]|uniref:SGNH hydrolase-type esterase domain-containing protein n=1 Tax=Kribbella koreensis TaxID=57909 RepID=A0ABP4C3K4_9ACTN